MNRFLIVFFLYSFVNIYSQGFICAVGGGSEDYNDWSDLPYGWIVNKADSGKIIIISDSDASNWLPNYFISLGASDSYNKKIDSRAVANLQSTYDELISADAIFIRGGDQWDYVELWKGTKTEDAVVDLFQNGGVAAGTSAGAAVLGDIDFTAKYGTAYPRASLINPIQTKLDFDDEFLDLQSNVIFDSHFIERGRFGRLIPMLYKIYFSLGRDIVGVGIDDKTAVCITPDGIGEVMGSGAVAFYYKDALTNYTEFLSDLYTIENLKCDQLTQGWKFNLNSREVEFIPPSGKQVDTSRSWQFPRTDFFLTGSDDISFDMNNSFDDFLSSLADPSIVVFSHQTFESSVQIVLDYLNQNAIENHLILLNQSSLNNPAYVQQINDADAFIFAGDSLAALSLLNQISEPVPAAFGNKINLSAPCYFFGNSGKVSGQYFIDNTDGDNYAAYRGKLKNHEGINLFGELIFQPYLFDDDDYFENRSSSVLWGLMLNRKRIGIYLDNRTNLRMNSGANSFSIGGDFPRIIVDARSTTYVDSSTYIAGSGVAPRQVVAMNNLRFSVTKYSGINYLIEQGKFDNLVNIEKKTGEFPQLYRLEQNYPNPFNPNTIIEFTLPEESRITLKIYNVLGKEITTLTNGIYPAGVYRKNFNAGNLSSGVYFFRIEAISVGRQAEEFIETKSMLLVR